MMLPFWLKGAGNIVISPPTHPTDATKHSTYSEVSVLTLGPGAADALSAGERARGGPGALVSLYNVVLHDLIKCVGLFSISPLRLELH